VSTVSTLTCVTSQGREIRMDLASLVSADLQETTRVEANRWIKRLRLVRYGEGTMRERFMYRGDSLWWFSELYLHKMRRLEKAIATIVALEEACARHAPARLIVEATDGAAVHAALAFGQAHRRQVDVRGTTGVGASNPRWSSYLIGLTATLSRLRPTRRPVPTERPAVATFVHTAFWPLAADADDPRRERYIGLVLDALAQRLAPNDLFFVGVGPRRNFRARRWWDPMTRPGARRLTTPIEQLAPRRALEGALDLWRTRRALARALTDGDDIRSAGVVRGCDLWPVLREQLEEIALLQWPWSARAMDEAGAALDALAPEVVVTYAEAGGWGRAIVIEARRRGVRSVGIQHGFIYRHWLNYLHEPDELAPLGVDRGFPLPDRTLVFDRYAAEHLETHGHFPAARLAITGNAGLEALSTRLATCRSEDRRDARGRIGVRDDQALALLAAKFTEIRGELPALVAAVSGLPHVHLVIKPHPAETAAVYESAARGAGNVSVAPADMDLAELLSAADGLVTMNSTVAIDGLALGIPALVVGLPNNLSPFVSAGVMLGADASEKIRVGLETLLYDREARQRLADSAERFVSRYGMRSTGRAAECAADEILGLTKAT
jgi:hypothetical protein